MNHPGLHRLLHGNMAPNTFEAAYVQLQIDAIISQIFQLQSRLAELEDQLQRHRAVLSPVRRMPAEVLGEIFVPLLSDDSQVGVSDNLVGVQLICKSWRDAARLTHQLWGALSFQDVTNVSYKKVKQWYSRAGGTLKSLAFSTIPHYDCTDQSFACGSLQSSALATLLVNLEGTLDHLSLGFRGPKCFQNLLGSLGGVEERPSSLQRRPWHPLKSFTLKFSQEWIESPEALRSMFLQLTPNITSLELRLPSTWSDAFQGGDSDTAPLPLPQNLLEGLLSFTLVCDWDGTRWLTAALSHCVNVETLTLDFIGTAWWYVRDQPHTESLFRTGLLLPNVRTLRLQNIHPGSTEILCALKAPQLVELDIDFNHGTGTLDSDFYEAVLSFVEGSKCDSTLRFFHLRNTCMMHQALADTLIRLHFLTRLTLDGIVLETSRACFIATMGRVVGGPQSLLPNLEMLELLNLRPEFSVNSLLDFLKSRRPHRMENGRPIFTNVQDPFKRLKVTYQTTKKPEPRLGRSEEVEVLRKWGGVHVNIGPILYVD